MLYIFPDMAVMNAKQPSTPTYRELPPEDKLTAATIRIIIDNYKGDVEAFFQDANRRAKENADDPESVLVRSFVLTHLSDR